MKSLFPPHVTRLESVVWVRDAGEFLRHVGPGTRAAVWQEGVRYDIGVPAASSFAVALSDAGVDLESICDVELWTPPVFFRRDGMPATGIGGMYAGTGSVFLCLNGPSFDEEARAMLANRPGVVTFAVNNGAHGFRPDLWACVDAPDRFMGSIWKDGRILKFVPVKYLAGGGSAMVREAPAVVGFPQNEAFCAERFLREDSMNWGNHKSRGGGRSVMLVALRIAWELGFRRVVLVGCDFHMDERRRYWFPEDRTEQAIRNNMTTYEILRGFFTELLPVFAEAGFAVVNATPGSGLDVFPLVDLDEEIAATTVDTGGSTLGMYGGKRK